MSKINRRIKNITDFKNAEKMLTYQALLLDEVNEAIIATDTNFLITYWNNAAERIYGWTAEEALGKNVDELFHSEFSAIDREELMKKLFTEKRVETEVIHTLKDGSKINVSNKVSLVYINGKTLSGTVSVIRDITRRKRAEEDLRQSEHKHQEIVKYAPAGIYEIDFREQRFLRVNDRMCQISGYSREEFLHMNPFDILQEHSKAKFRERVNQWLAGMEPETTVEFTVITKDGREIIVELNVSLTRDENSNPKGANVVAHDVTERKRAEDQFAFQAHLLSTVHDAIIALDENMNIIYWNDMAGKITGWSTVEATELSGKEIFHKSKVDILWPLFTAQLDASGYFTGEIAMVRKEGSTITIDLHMKRIYGSSGEFKGTISSFRDITERKRAEEALAAERQRLYDVLETLPVDIRLITPDYHVLFGNRAFREKFGDSNGRQCNDFCYGFTEPCKFCESFEPFKTGRPHKWQFTSMDSKFIIDVYDFPFKDTDGSPLILEMHIDITESMRAEEVLNKSYEALEKANEMKDEFLSLVSHEFKTPITVINSAVQAMRQICRDELSEKSNSFLNKIIQNSNRQLKLVNNLLDITRINAGNIKINLMNVDIIHMTRTITESIIVFAEQKGIRLSFSSTLEEKITAIDEEKYERILLNLLSNAIKFTPRGKSIFVRTSQKIIKGKCKVCIQVKDQGIGIPPDKQQLIFERFGQVDSSLSRQAEGTGIGLSLVKMFVGNMGGEIAVESEMGKGSTFTVLFPVTKIKDTLIEKKLQEITDNRLIQATAIEFSDIFNT